MDKFQLTRTIEIWYNVRQSNEESAYAHRRRGDVEMGKLDIVFHEADEGGRSLEPWFSQLPMCADSNEI